jgi:hypothetical protein
MCLRRLKKRHLHLEKRHFHPTTTLSVEKKRRLVFKVSLPFDSERLSRDKKPLLVDAKRRSLGCTASLRSAPSD